MPKNFSRIASLGFKKVGHWQLVNEQLDFELDPDARDERNVLYAFVVNGGLAYVGKTTQSLRDRLQRYKTPAKDAKNGGSTNIKNNRHIRTKLKDGMVVEIHAFLANEERNIGGFSVNFAAALEDSLISELKPPWNGRGSLVEIFPTSTKVDSQAKVVVEQKTKAAPRLTVEDFKVVLCRKLHDAASAGVSYIDIVSGALHREIGGYPEQGHAMPVCCSVMRREMRQGDEVLAAPPKGKGATLKIRYLLPR